MAELEASDDNVTIRHATKGDRDALAALHVLVWRDTYGLLAPAVAYEALDEVKRREHWDELLVRDPDHWVTMVATLDGALVGFGHAGPGTHEVMHEAGEVVHLYVDPTSQGRGIGRALLRQLKQFLTGSGHSVIKLAVVADNDHAVRFYEREGARVVGNFVDGVLWRSDNLVMEFTLDPLGIPAV